MSGGLVIPPARWWCAELGVVSPAVVTPDESRTWTYADFGDGAVSRRGATLSVIGSAWSVTNNSTTMQSLYLLDVRYGRRLVAPLASLPLLQSRSWVLLPSVEGDDRPHVVAVHAGVAPGGPSWPGSTQPDARSTKSSGEPSGLELVEGLDRARQVLTDADVRALLATFARPYFTVQTGALAPASRQQVAICLPGSEDRGERAMRKMREALWGRADRQDARVVVRLLVQHGLVGYRDVTSVRHDRRCGHGPADLDPAAHARAARRPHA